MTTATENDVLDVLIGPGFAGHYAVHSRPA